MGHTGRTHRDPGFNMLGLTHVLSKNVNNSRKLNILGALIFLLKRSGEVTMDIVVEWLFPRILGTMVGIFTECHPKLERNKDLLLKYLLFQVKKKLFIIHGTCEYVIQGKI